MQQTLQRRFAEFLRNDERYRSSVEAMLREEKSSLDVEWRDLLQVDSELAQDVQHDFFRFQPALADALRELARELQPEIVHDDKHFVASFRGLAQRSRLQDLRCRDIGRLQAVVGTVTRTSAVRPELHLGAFRCTICGDIVRGVQQQFKFTEPVRCSNRECDNRSDWDLVVGTTDGSRFVDWQRVRVQEYSADVPSGAMPRSIDVIVRGDVVDDAKPGDHAVFTGCLVVVPDVSQLYAKAASAVVRSDKTTGVAGGVTGTKQLGVRNLTYKLAFLAVSVESLGDKEQQPQATTPGHGLGGGGGSVPQQLAGLTNEQRQRLLRMSRMPDIAQRLARTVAPNIFGHQDIKLGVLLMLFGGVHKRTREGIGLRGDINICILGDAATAKSQFLKFVTRFSPRALYTSGKASSAAGLTASVVRDADTGEFGIQAGALMLADNGICCIDEFDKMDPIDQAAIHEAMEQQTISISKAGIQATLNARASILAAANPIGGRYDVSRSLRQNVAISPPILSRFDLFFVVLDECNPAVDERIARHVLRLHQAAASTSTSGRRQAQRRQQQQQQEEFTAEEVRSYIHLARRIRPKITRGARRKLVEVYGELRGADATGVHSNAYRITVRQLESVVRLSEAYARLHLSSTVTEQHVAEAARLVRTCITSIGADDVVLGADDELQSTAVGAMRDDDNHSGDEDTPDADLTITWSTFKTITARLLEVLRRDGRSHCRVAELVREYLQRHGDTEDADALQRQRLIVLHVVARLINVDAVLVCIDDADGGALEERIVTAVN